MESHTPKQVYTPHLKRVLRSFQASAHSSLHGPNSVMGVWPTATEKSASSSSSTETSSSSSTATTLKSPDEQDQFTAPAPFPIQQPPIFTPSDQSGWVPSETILENETISCFTVGGEKRLCLPQILNTVLRGFSLQQINCVCDTLHIFCSRCTTEQLEVLKGTGILPLSAPSCGLITKSDAERLCSALRDSNPPKVIRNPDAKQPFQVRVYHECFGHCTGLYTPDLYLDPLARCIECAECHGLFSPHKFVCHAHHIRENRTCHWGFDSFNWRCYLLLDADLENDSQMMEILKEMKNRYDYCYDYNHKYKRKQLVSESRESSKKIRMENLYPYNQLALDPTMVYWYSNPGWNKVSSYRPFASVFTRDDKSLLVPPEALSHYLRERSAYFLHEPTLLHNTDHVLPISVNDRYETHFNASVISSARKLFQDEHPCSIPQSEKPPDLDIVMKDQASTFFKKELRSKLLASCCFDSEDTFSDTTSSTLSAGTEDGLALALEEDDTISQSSDLQSLQTLLTENIDDDSLRTKILEEIEAVIAKYQKCLNASYQSKKRISTEYEKIHANLRRKIRRLQGSRRTQDKEVRKFPIDKTMVEKTVSRPGSTIKEIVESQPCPEDVTPCIKKSDNHKAEEKHSSTVTENSLDSSQLQPKQVTDVKVELVGN